MIVYSAESTGNVTGKVFGRFFQKDREVDGRGRHMTIKDIAKQCGVSISTVQQAYYLLEEKQLITPQPRSGYFVTPRKAVPPIPPMTRPVQRPVEVTQWDRVLELVNARLDNDVFQLGSGMPDVSQPTITMTP